MQLTTCALVKMRDLFPANAKFHAVIIARRVAYHSAFKQIYAVAKFVFSIFHA